MLDIQFCAHPVTVPHNVVLKVNNHDNSSGFPEEQLAASLHSYYGCVDTTSEGLLPDCSISMKKTGSEVECTHNNLVHMTM